MSSTSTNDRALAVYEADTRGLPKLQPYWQEVWRRRRFATQVARADLRARNYDTVLGQLWIVVNPALLAGVYFLLVTVILGSERGGVEYVGVLLSGLFAFYFTRNALNSGARSIVAGGNLVSNTAFPRALLPLSAVSAFLTYMPMLGVYAVFHLAAGFPLGRQTLWLIPLLALHTVFNAGLAMGLAAATVFLRDTTSALPYMLRIWLYVSPVLYTVDQIPAAAEPYLAFNPLYSILGAWQAVVIDGEAPGSAFVAASAGWALASLCAGAGFFLLREREFALRI
jgi:teichoic acid transport system permease protein